MSSIAEHVISALMKQRKQVQNPRRSAIEVLRRRGVQLQPFTCLTPSRMRELLQDAQRDRYGTPPPYAATLRGVIAQTQRISQLENVEYHMPGEQQKEHWY